MQFANSLESYNKVNSSYMLKSFTTLIKFISVTLVSGITWAYKSIVIDKEVCPRISFSVFGFMPFSIALVANVSRNAWALNLSIPALLHFLRISRFTTVSFSREFSDDLKISSSRSDFFFWRKDSSVQTSLGVISIIFESLLKLILLSLFWFSIAFFSSGILKKIHF